jgi:hypothetical protein
MALAGKIMEGAFIKDMAQEANEQGQNLEAAVQNAWKGNVDPASNQIAEVAAAIVFAGLQAMLLKLAEGVAVGGMGLVRMVKERLHRTPRFNNPVVEKWAEEEIAATQKASHPPADPMKVPAALRPHSNITPLPVGADFKPELNALERDFLKPIEQLGDASSWNVSPAYKSMEAHLPLEEFRTVAEEYRKFYRETLGHIQAVQAGAQMADAYLAAMRARGPITPALCKEFFPSLNDKEAIAAANVLSKITRSLAEAFKRHDVDSGAIKAGVGSKLSVPVGKGMRLPATSAERLLAVWEDKFLKENPGSTRAQFMPALRARLAKNPTDLHDLMEGFRVDRSRILHSDSFWHHNPKNPEDWVEFGIDVIAALSQSRCYRPNDPGRSPGAIKIGAAEGDFKTPGVYDCAMLKVGRTLMLDLEEKMGQDFIRKPQASLGHLI